MKSIKRLPAGFRHFFSQKEVRSLEDQAGIRFEKISFGHLLNTTRFDKQQSIQRSLRPLSIGGFRSETGWMLNLKQSGFRDELLPKELEAEAKLEVAKSVITYIAKLLSSVDTDFIERPQLWITIHVADSRLQILTRELI